MGNYSNYVRIIKEAATLHPDAIHYAPHQGSHMQFKVHKVGSNFAKHVKVGDVVKSSEIDDLADAGAKLKQIKHTAMKEGAEKPSHVTKSAMLVSRPGRETSRVSSTAADVGGGRKIELSTKAPKDPSRGVYEPASRAKPKGKLPEETEVIQEVHADAIHYAPHQGSHMSFKIHKVGSNFAKHVKPGDVVKSSEIDDLADAGARLKQIKHKQ